MTGPWLSDSEQRVWRDLLRLQRDLPARLNRQLQADSGLSVAEYAVLVQLSEADREAMRPVRLREELGWEQSRLSHLLIRMERRGLVSRGECSEDGRGTVVSLTPGGRAAIEAAAPGHVSLVRQLIFDNLTPEEADRFGHLCAAILTAITP